MIPLLAEIVRAPHKLDCIKHPTVLEIESLNFSFFHLICLILFVLAVIHTLSTRKIHAFARRYELRHTSSSLGKKWTRTPFMHFLFFLSEIEIVFAFWAIPLFIIMGFMYDWTTSLEYINSRDYTESLFVVVILAMTATRPIIHLAETTLAKLAQFFHGSLSAWWFILLTIGPLLGSLITEVGAMTLCALLLSRQFYAYHPSTKLSYATLGLLFVNVSVGGVLTNFASPAILILTHCWHLSTPYMLVSLGWKAILGVVLANSIYWMAFRQELAHLDRKKRVLQATHFIQVQKPVESPIPSWIVCIHAIFIAWIVFVSHYPAIFIASFLFFIGFHQATRPHQYPIRVVRPMLVGLFLAGLIIHGGLQGWWVVHLLADLSNLAVLGITILLAGFIDNAAIAYLATLIPHGDDVFKYAIFTGVVAGGGLTVIANAPNPAGYAILKQHFQDGPKPLYLLLGALTPTVLFYAIFYFLGPLFKA